MDLLRAWGLDSFPALVLLRSDGTVADMHPMTFDASSLAVTLDALQAGGAIPDPRPLPTPPAGEPLSTVLKPDAIAPGLTGPRLGGGELSTRDLRGRPTIVQFWLPPISTAPRRTTPGAGPPAGCGRQPCGEVNVLLVARGEPELGAARRYLRLRQPMPVIFDWDGGADEPVGPDVP